MPWFDAAAEIDADSAAAMAGVATLVDVREDEEWVNGHAPAAIHIPMGRLADRVGELQRERRIICICRSGNRSASTTAWLRSQGFDAVNMTGGMRAWAVAGHPVVSHDGGPGIVI